MHQCNICKKEFKYKYLLIKHESRKRKCGNIEDIIENYKEKIEVINKEILEKTEISLEKKMQCLFCNKIFINKTNIKRHIDNNCNIKIDLLNEKTKLENEINEINEKNNNREHENQIQELRNTIMKLLKKQSANINITNNKNKITNNNLVVNINSFGNENLSHITKNDYKKYLSGLFSGFIKFIEKVHFDENMPENHNICITNLKSKYICVYDDSGKWIAKDKNETIDRFIDKKYNLLVNKLDEMDENNEIDEKTMNNFLRFTENYKDKEAQKITKNDIILLIYNNKNKVNMK